MRTAVVVVGLSFGDEGKGTVVDAVVRRTGARMVVRFSGGAQAGHNVVAEDGRHHCFAQFGAGTLAGAHTYLGPRVVVDPLALWVEAAALGDPRAALATVWLHPEAPVVTPYHRGLNRARELARGAARHGSCGVGVGEVARDLEEGVDVLRAADVRRRAELTVARLEAVRRRAVRAVVRLCQSGLDPDGAAELLMHELAVDPRSWLDRARGVLVHVNLSPGLSAGHDVVVFEGAQGVLLDERWGFHPHTTWSTCTPAWAVSLLADWREQPRVVRVGVLRAFATRHGPGPFPTEAPARHQWTAGEHNAAGAWQGPLRYGHFDAVLARYAVRVCPVDLLALTCLDRLPPGPWTYADAYRVGAARVLGLTPGATLEAQERVGRWLGECEPVYRDAALDEPLAERLVGVPVGLASYGPTARHKVFHRAWQAALGEAEAVRA